MFSEYAHLDSVYGMSEDFSGRAVKRERFQSPSTTDDTDIAASKRFYRWWYYRSWKQVRVGVEVTRIRDTKDLDALAQISSGTWLDFCQTFKVSTGRTKTVTNFKALCCNLYNTAPSYHSGSRRLGPQFTSFHQNHTRGSMVESEMSSYGQMRAYTLLQNRTKLLSLWRSSMRRTPSQQGLYLTSIAGTMSEPQTSEMVGTLVAYIYREDFTWKAERHSIDLIQFWYLFS